MAAAGAPVAVPQQPQQQGLAQGVIQRDQVFLHPNKKGRREPHEIGIDYLETANGVFRAGQFLDRFFGLWNKIAPSENVRNLSAVFRGMWTVTIIPHLPFATRKAVQTLAKVNQPTADTEATRRKYVETVHDVTDVTTSWLYASSLLSGCIEKTAGLSLPILRAADMITFVKDTADAEMNAEDFNKARVMSIKAEQIGGPEMKEIQDNLVQTQRYHFLRTLKAVCGVVGFIFGLYLTTLGLALPGLAIAAASVSLAATVFGMSAGLYEESMKYERVKFFDQRHVQHLPAAPRVALA